MREIKIKEEKYRSEGHGVNECANRVRIIVDCDIRDRLVLLYAIKQVTDVWNLDEKNDNSGIERFLKSIENKEKNNEFVR